MAEYMENGADLQEKEMEILFAEKDVTIGGETLTIKPYSWMQSMKAVQPVGALMHALVSHIDEVDAILQSIAGGNSLAQQVDAIARLAGEVESERLAEAVSILLQLATGKPRAYIEGLLIDDAARLGMAVYEVNKHFFKQRLAKLRTPGEKGQ